MRQTSTTGVALPAGLAVAAPVLARGLGLQHRPARRVDAAPPERLAA